MTKGPRLRNLTLFFLSASRIERALLFMYRFQIRLALLCRFQDGRLLWLVILFKLKQFLSSKHVVLFCFVLFKINKHPTSELQLALREYAQLAEPTTREKQYKVHFYVKLNWLPQRHQKIAMSKEGICRESLGVGKISLICGFKWNTCVVTWLRNNLCDLNGFGSWSARF